MGNQQGSSFPYDVTEAIESYPSGWVLKNGWRVADHYPVSVFVFTDTSQSNNKDNSHGENLLRRFKMLRHPHILNCLEGIEMEQQIFVVTDRVRPLKHTVDSLKKEPALLSWGLCSIMTAVEWLNSTGKIHGNLLLDSIFVDKEGDWKLGGFEFLTEVSNLQAIDRNFIPRWALPPELERREQVRRPDFPAHAIDAWMMAGLIWSIFSDHRFSDRQQLKQIAAIPADLLEGYKNLIKLQPAQRTKIGALLDSKYFQNPLVETCRFMEEINIKDSYEKERFFLKLPELIGDFPDFFCKYKLLPLLVHSLDFGSAGSIVLGPVLKIGKKLTEEEFQQMVAPSVIKWLKSPDRLVRINLLNNVNSFAALLPVDMINDSIYPSISTGFADSDHELRCASVRSVLSLASKLNVNTINNHLLKCLGKLQVDPVPLIRAMTTQCVTKIAKLLKPETREKVLVAAFSRALRDPHAPSRVTGINGFQETKQLYTMKDCASHVVPAISYMTVDPNPEVRTEAIGCLKEFVKLLEEGQATLPKEEPKPGEQQVDNGMLGWAISSISSKILVANDPHNPSQQPNQGSQQSAQSIPTSPSQELQSAAKPPVSKPTSVSSSSSIASSNKSTSILPKTGARMGPGAASVPSASASSPHSRSSSQSRPETIVVTPISGDMFSDEDDDYGFGSKDRGAEKKSNNQWSEDYVDDDWGAPKKRTPESVGQSTLPSQKSSLGGPKVSSQEEDTRRGRQNREPPQKIQASTLSSWEDEWGAEQQNIPSQQQRQTTKRGWNAEGDNWSSRPANQSQPQQVRSQSRDSTTAATKPQMPLSSATAGHKPTSNRSITNKLKSGPGTSTASASASRSGSASASNLGWSDAASKGGWEDDFSSW